MNSITATSKQYPTIVKPAKCVPAAVAALVLLLIGPLAAGQQATQSLDSIREAAESFVLAQLEAKGPGVVAEAGRLDRRLRLSACEQPLEAFNAAGSRLGGNTSVGIRCTGQRPWKIYVPVKVSREVEVAVLARSLPRGAALDSKAVRMQRLDTSTLGFGYYEDLERVTGQTLRRAAAAGTVITPALVAVPPTIRKDEQVTLLAERAGIAIRAPGRALKDAQIGDIIQVRNLSSETVVEGVVRGPGEVAVHVP
nr:flagellar basal body P-ring formation chaperone FlgA [Wenzhouxiangella limi]